MSSNCIGVSPYSSAPCHKLCVAQHHQRRQMAGAELNYGVDGVYDLHRLRYQNVGAPLPFP